MKREWMLLWVAQLALAACGGREQPQKSDEGGENASTMTERHKRAAEPEREASPKSAASALDEALSLPAGEERNQRLVESAWQGIEEDAETARRGIEALPAEHPDRVRLLQHLAMRHAEADPEAALAEALKLPSELERSAAVGSIALVLSENDPQKAAGLISEHGVAGRDLGVAVVQVVRRWADQDPAAAAAWASAFPPGEFRQAGWGAVFQAWLPRDAAAAIGWCASLGDVDLRGEALRGLADTLRDEPEEIRTARLKTAAPGFRAEIEAALNRSTAP